MIDRTDIVHRAEELLEDRLADMGYEFVACDWRVADGRTTLQVFIDREGGVGIRDCVEVNKRIGDLLDVEDFISLAYNLQVSSPGLERPLRREEHFRQFIGKEARIRTYEPIDGRKNYRGFIVGAKDGIVEIKVDGVDYSVPVAAMERANLVFVYEKPAKPGKKHSRSKKSKKNK